MASINLRVRLSCRAAKWASDASTKLERLFPTDPSSAEAAFKVVRLLPLTQPAIRQLAAERLVTDVALEGFFREMDGNGVAALAGHPVLLASLADEFSKSKSLGKSRTQLYERAT